MKEKLYREITVGDSKYPLERYLVVFLDILGQADTLSSLQADFKKPFLYDIGIPNGMPIGKLEIHENLMHDFRKCFSPVWNFREAFFENVEKLKTRQLERHSHLKNLKIPINFESSSDNIWICAPLKNNDECSEMLTILTALHALVISYIGCIANQIPFRGGVTISYGFEMPNYNSKDTNYYGPGLARAAKLEKEASFPRIILDKIVYTLIKSYEINAEHSTNEFITTSGELAKECLKYIKEYAAPCLDDNVEKDDAKYIEKYTLIPPSNIPGLNDTWIDAIKFANSEINNHSDKYIANKYRNLYNFLKKFKSSN